MVDRCRRLAVAVITATVSGDEPVLKSVRPEQHCHREALAARLRTDDFSTLRNQVPSMNSLKQKGV